jgi:hypothetical protein
VPDADLSADDDRAPAGIPATAPGEAPTRETMPGDLPKAMLDREVARQEGDVPAEALTGEGGDLTDGLSQINPAADAPPADEHATPHEPLSTAAAEAARDLFPPAPRPAVPDLDDWEDGVAEPARTIPPAEDPPEPDAPAPDEPVPDATPAPEEEPIPDEPAVPAEAPPPEEPPAPTGDEEPAAADDADALTFIFPAEDAPIAEPEADPVEELPRQEAEPLLADEPPLAAMPEELPPTDDGPPSPADEGREPGEGEEGDGVASETALEPDVEPEQEQKPEQEQEQELETGQHAFLYTAAPAARASVRGSTVLLVVAALLCLLLVGAMLTWYFTARVTPAAQAPAEVGLAYLTALSAGDVVTQPQLATRDSSGLRVPAWLTVVTARPDGGAAVRDDTATLPCRLTLAPAPGDDAPPTAVVEATRQPVDLDLPLQREDGAWRVNQRAFFDTLKAILVTRAAKLPAWQ